MTVSRSHAGLVIRVTDAATRQGGTTASLPLNSWIELNDLFYGTMLPSGNDAAFLLAQLFGYLLTRKGAHKLQQVDLGSQNTTPYVANFVRAMNTKAEQLGLVYTRFSNPHGLQNAMNISTARDVLQLSVKASQHPLFKAIMGTQYHQATIYASATRQQRTPLVWRNTNVLLQEGWEGLKTGQTLSAGACLSSVRHGLYIVLLNCADPERRFTQTQALYNWFRIQYSI